MSDEYSDSIEKFRSSMPPQQMPPQQMPPQQMPPQQNIDNSSGAMNMKQQGPSPEQLAIMRQKQQQAMMQQQHQQAMMQQQQQQHQQAMMQQQQENFNNKPKTFMDRIKKLKSNENLKEMLLLAILFIIFSTSFYKDNLCKIPFVSVDNGCLNTAGLLLSAILIAVNFIIIKTFI